MAKRFGRNQKRRMREQLAAQKGEIARLETENRVLGYGSVQAESRALAAFLADAGRYEYMCNRLVDMAARELGEHLRPQVESIMREARARDHLLLVGARRDFHDDAPVRIISITVPAIHCHHADKLLR